MHKPLFLKVVSNCEESVLDTSTLCIMTNGWQDLTIKDRDKKSSS